MSATRKIINIFFYEAWKFKKRVLFSVSNASVSVLVSSFAAPFIISVFLDKIQAGSEITLSQVWPMIAAYGVTQLYGEVIGWRLTLLCTWTFETAAQRNLYKRIFVHLSNQSIAFHANKFGGSLVSQTNKLVGAFERFWDTLIFQVMPTATSIIAAVTILGFIFWQYALILSVLCIIFVVTIFFGSRKMGPFNIAEAQASTELTGRLADVVTNIIATKSHGHEKYEVESYDKIATNWRSKSLQTMWAFLKISTVYSGLMATLNIAALVTAVWAAQYNLIAISTVYLSITYTFTVARQLWEMNNIMRNYHRVMGDAHDMALILYEEPAVLDEPNAKIPKFKRGSIDFDNVIFAHENAAALFTNFTLHIKPGEKVGLVGHSGGGKTTLTKLLLRFMDIQHGAIRVDGQNIAKLRQSDLRKRIAYVPQEPVLFHRSIAENIGYGQLGSSKAAIKGASKLANAHEFVDKLPDGYDTLVGERGVKLSGGQRQRIAIARAMLKNAPILVLDEATSALDSESEELIQDALWKLMENRTAIVIAHRLSTVQKMDRILVLEDGKIVEEGTHKELVRRDGTYAKLWSKQSGGFIEE